MDAKIKVMLQIEIPRLNEDIELASIRHRLNDYVSTLIPRINIQELMDWSLLICVTFRSTNGIGVFKKARRYSSNKEFEFESPLNAYADSKPLSIIKFLSDIHSFIYKRLNPVK